MSNYRWVILFASFFTFVAFAYVFQLVPPLIDMMKDSFGVDEAEAGLLMSMAVLPGIVLALPAGLIVQRYGIRLLGFVSVVLVGAGSVLTAVADTFLTALLGRFILGIGGTFIVVGMPALIQQWFSHEDLGKAMGIYATNMPVATITAFPTATILAQQFDWRYPFFVGAAISLVCAVIFAAAAREGPLKGDSKPLELNDVKSAVGNVEIWKVSLVWMFFNTAAIAFLSWAKTLFQDYRGLGPLQASLLASVFMYAAVIFVPIFGWASDRSRRRKPFIEAGSILMALALIATAYTLETALYAFVVVLGIAAAMVPPIVMTVAAESLPSHLTGLSFSIVTLCQNLGIALAAPFAGYIIQTTQSVEMTLFGTAFFAFAGAVTAFTLRTK